MFASKLNSPSSFRRVWLRDLDRLTGLQHLAVDLPTPPAAAPDGHGAWDNVAQLQQAVPALTHLTALHLSHAAADDSTLTHLSRLTSLQELKLTDVDSNVTQASFRTLPVSLTRLKFEGDILTLHTADVGPQFSFSPSSTPGLCQLTALQELEMQARACKFHTATITALPVLRKLSLRLCDLTAGDGGPVLAPLTHLEHLELPLHIERFLVSSADYAALTASPQLTYLGLSCCFGPEHVLDAFPDTRRLSKLVSLTVFINWLQETDTIQRIVDCCPALQELSVECHGGNDVAEIVLWLWAASLGCLTELSALTCLKMSTLEVRMTSEVFRAIAALTGLRELRIDTMDPNELGSAVHLTSCRQLTRLEIAVFTNQQEEEDFRVDATNKAPAGSPPDVWRQIPSLILQAAANYMETGEGGGAAVRSLLRAAAQAASQALQREEELEGRVGSLEQQVAQLQASMAAVLQHLQLPAA